MSDALEALREQLDAEPGNSLFIRGRRPDGHWQNRPPGSKIPTEKAADGTLVGVKEPWGGYRNNSAGGE